MFKITIFFLSWFLFVSYLFGKFNMNRSWQSNQKIIKNVENKFLDKKRKRSEGKTYKKIK